MIKETQTYKNLKDSVANNKPVWIITHHSGGTDANPLADTSKHTARQVEQWHLSKGWSGLGYHFFLTKNGDIWRGRPEHRNGAHAKGYNTKSIGICLAGNFDATLPTEAQTIALKGLLKRLMTKYKIPASKIIPHRRVAKKTCYGRLLPDTWAKDLVRIDTKVKTLKDYSTKELVMEILLRYK